MTAIPSFPTLHPPSYTRVMAYLLGPCGGNGGDEKNMSNDSANHITKLQIRHGAAIDGVNILYQPSGGGSVWTNWRGGSGGQLSEFNLDDDEFLTAITGFYSPSGNTTLVRALTFTSNKRIYGPFGKEEGVKFNLKAPTKIVAFTARSGALLDAIGIYVV